MSDFLTNLVARTIAQPSLRPRTQSRFEPPSIEEAPLVWPVSAQRLPAPDRVEEPPAAETPMRELEHAEETPDAIRPAMRNAAPPETRNRESRPTEQRAARDEIAPEPRIVHVPKVNTRVLHSVEHDVERIVETAEHLVAVPQRIESEPRTIVERARPHRFEHEPPRVIRERQRGETIHRERELRTTIDRPPRIVRDRAESRAAVSNSEPVIEVSIGRIEVRAVSSSAAQRQQPPRNAAMTIEDYVAKRKAKERG